MTTTNTKSRDTIEAGAEQSKKRFKHSKLL
jgi:hypothetical protein